MRPFYYVTDAETGAEVPATIRPAKKRDYQITERDNWQTSWLAAYLREE